VDAVARGRRVAEADLPPHSLPSDGPPPPRAWADRDPDAAARLAAARAGLAELSERWQLPVENLVTPDTVRRLMWSPPAAADLEVALAAYGARPWQVQVAGPVLRAALAETAATRAARERAAAAAGPEGSADPDPAP
jgi:ribonuclease D